MKKHRWLSGILQKSVGRQRSARHSVPSMRIESLEARSLLTVQGVSLADPDNLGDTANGESDIGGRSVSNDGRYAVVLSSSPNLIQGQIDRDGTDAFLFDRQTEQFSLISHQAGSSVATAGSVILAEITGDGRYVAFLSSATDLVTGQIDSNGSTDVFLFDRLNPSSIVLVSHAAGSATTAGNAGSGLDILSLSDDGRYVCYTSSATNLVSGQSDTFNTRDVFVFDRTTGTSALVSHAAGPATTAGNFGGDGAKISANGNIIGFSSASTNLVSGLNDANGTNSDVFLYAVGSGTITLASRTAASANTTGNAFSYFYDLSADGQFVVFTSRADDLLNGFVDVNDPNVNFNQISDVYLFSGGTNVLVSHAAGLLTTTGNSESNYDPHISADGNWIVFGSQATNLVAGQNDQNSSIDLFLYNRTSQTSTLVSGANGSATTTGNAFTGISTISDDGQKITFQSSATDLISGVTDVSNSDDAFLFDRSSGTTLLSHTASSVTTAGNFAGLPIISGDGTVAYFSSGSTDVLSGIRDFNNTDDVFTFDVSSSTTELVTEHAAGMASNTGSDRSFSENGLYGTRPQVSDNGRYVVFSSEAKNLVAGQTDTNQTTNIFVRDVVTNITTLVSRSTAGSQAAGNNSSSNPVISGDGRYIAYVSDATDLIVGLTDSNNQSDVFVFDSNTGMTFLVSASAVNATTTANQLSSAPVISSDGKYIAFSSAATNLLVDQDDTNSGADLFLFDRELGTVTLVTHAADSALQTAVTSTGRDTAISSDGQFIAYTSRATNLVAGQTDSNNQSDVFVFDRVTNTNALVSRTAGSAVTTANAASYSTITAISSNGQYIAFASQGTDLVASLNNVNGTREDVFVFDRVAGTTTLASHAPGTALTTGNFASYDPSISGDGSFVFYVSEATNLVASQSDSNSGGDIFAYSRVGGTNSLVSHASGSSTTTANSDSGYYSMAVSADGRFVVYETEATNLVNGLVDSNNNFDVFLYDQQSGSTRLLSHAMASDTTVANGFSGEVQLSANGKVAVFTSDAVDLIANDFNGRGDVFAFSLNNPPTNIALSGSGPIAENGAAGIVIGSFTTTDPDSGDTHTFSFPNALGSNTLFTIVGNELRTAGPFDFESDVPLTILVRTTDQGGLFFEKSFVISSSNVNETPTNVGVSATTVAENSAVGTVVGTLSFSDPDAGGSHSFSLASGDGDSGNGLFTITGNQLKVATNLNFEIDPTVSIRLRTTDQGGLSFDRIVIVTVTDVAEPPSDITLSANTIVENSAIGTVIGMLTGTDPEDGTDVTLTLVSGVGSTNNAEFTIVENELRSTAIFDFETQPTRSIRVRATDSGSLFFDKVLTISVTNDPTDTDLDGVPEDEEDAGPNNGDGNMDGTPDSEQDNVATLPNNSGEYVTFSVPDGTTIVNVSAMDNPSPAETPAEAVFPLGFFSFEIPGLTAGAATTVDLILHSGATPSSYFKFGPTPDNTDPHFYEFLFDGTTGAEINGNQVKLHFVDGARGDSDLLANGVIVDPGAPGFAAFKPVTFTLTAANANTRLQVNADNSHVELVNAASGVVLLDLTAEGITQLTVNGGREDNRLTVDYSNGDPLPADGLFFNSGRQRRRDELVIVGGGDLTEINHSFTNRTDGTIDLDGKTISYTGLEVIVDQIDALNRAFQFPALRDIVVLQDAERANNGLLKLSNGSRSVPVTFASPTESLTIRAGAGNDDVEVRALDPGFAPLATITVEGEAGRDTILATQVARSIRLDGGNDADTLRGGSGHDVLLGGGGNDNLASRAGDDLLDGGLGNDLMYGEAGDDTLLGDAGRDTILGGRDNDRINGGIGNDFLYGGSGNDTIRGGGDDDWLDGGSDNDTLLGEGGRDTVFGQSDTDRVGGGSGAGPDVGDRVRPYNPLAQIDEAFSINDDWEVIP